tara:strand:+ start:261 stop:470 length:210 start_codon:yes stop_codon:yes gene_type:complete
MTISTPLERIAQLETEKAELIGNFNQANEVITNIRQRAAEIEGALKELKTLVPEESEASDTEGAVTLQE